MPDTTALIREKIRTCNLPALFIEELGWNHHRTAPLIVESEGDNYTLNAIAEKHGMVAYECQPGPKGQMPDYPTRGKIERQVAKSAHEHIVVFVNKERTIQTWQWVRREKGKPTARREHTYVCNQPGDSLIQKLHNLVIGLEEEENLTIVDVTGKARQAFDVDRVTKRFFEHFEKEHKAFLSFIEGITAVADREWYASLMLNRLMFIYFIQKKGFLDGDIHYLRHRLEKVRTSQGKGKFHTFYRQFLLRLFHEGLARRKEDRTAELDTLLGKVPYLNGGLFDTHQLERDNPDTHIPDEAFEKLFDFFDEYQWHLDERPNRDDKEINPDVLGYIFEKYINQKQMGAYYTKEDITEYISKSTVVPFLFDSAEKKCAVAFQPHAALWRLTREAPDRYLFDAIKKGVDIPLPAEIAAGFADVSKRGGWNRPADDEYALPTETWREHMARRTRCLEVRAKLSAGEVHSINDFITYNLDLRQFAQDVIETSEGPELLRAFYQGIEEISVLDPTCGSGAFLFAALNILEPLYEACLDRMEVFVSELDRSVEKHHPEKYSDFRKVLEQANDRAKHPSRKYFVLKSIVLKNLYGVDIMAEAVEICKLRLFLKLVAQVERVEDVEPLPDIDFNIRAGNTLVGFTSLDALKRSMTITPDGRYRMLSTDDEAALKSIDENAELADRAFSRFREQQTEYGMQASHYSDAKGDLQARLADLRTELDRYLATEYGVDLRKPAELARWRTSHQPFHWFVEFYRIMRNGGFDVIIGNPPYIEYSKVRGIYTVKNIKCLEAGNLYAYIIERSLDIEHQASRTGMIIQLSAFCTPRMKPFQDMFFGLMDIAHLSFFDDRPGKLFDGLEHIRVAITVGRKGTNSPSIATTRYIKFATEARPILFESIAYQLNSQPRHGSSVLKVSVAIENDIVKKLWSAKHVLADYLQEDENDNYVYYGYGFGYWGKILNHKSFFKGQKVKASTGDKYIFCSREINRDAVTALMNSSLFYWFYVNYSDGHNFTKHVIGSFPFETPHSKFTTELTSVCGQLMDDLQTNSQRKTAYYQATGKVEYEEFYPRLSKLIIDKIDSVLAKHYGFTAEELDFIINYDVKYRMGADSDDGDEE
ncbi:MAG: Eco57I restriction-modification methylase domain-containing protein [Dehalococcoidales bacterium]|nr:Eco57I restriction-modification methylase domain-containing protein [Dehalococcoidales bacterium]